MRVLMSMAYTNIIHYINTLSSFFLLLKIFSLSPILVEDSMSILQQK